MSKSGNHQSRRKTPWDRHDTMTPTQNFLSERYESQYNERHPKLTETGEAALINAVIPETCPYCQHDGTSRFGKTENGIQRYAKKAAERPLHPLPARYLTATRSLYQRMDGVLSEHLPVCQHER
jgi:hypothetical protein